MITHIKHDTGTEALAKKLNEVIRVVNEGVNPSNIQCDPQLLISCIEQYGEYCRLTMQSGNFVNQVGWKMAEIKGMLGIK